MSSNTKFIKPVAIDNDQSCAFYKDKGLYKLSLNDISDGDFSSLENWLRATEIFIMSDTARVDTGNRYSDFRRLPFAWRVEPFNAYPENDITLGIPDDLAMFYSWYKGDLIEDPKLADVIPVETGKTDGGVTTFDYSVKSNAGNSVEATKATLTMYYGGVSHKDLGLTFPKFFEPANVAKIRFSLKNFVAHILTCLPDGLAMQFKRGAIPNWTAMRNIIFSYKKCLLPKPDMLRLRSLIQFCASPKTRNIKIRSKVTALRETLWPFLKKYESKIDLSEAVGEIVGYSGLEKYSPIINFLLQLISAMNEDHRTLENAWEIIAGKVECKPNELSIKDILSDKALLYDKIDTKNKADKEFDLRVFNRACQNVKFGIEDEYSRILTANKSTPKVNINTVDNGDDSDGEDFYEDEEGFFYQRVEKRNFRRPPIRFKSGLGRGGQSGRGAKRGARSGHPFGEGKWNTYKAPRRGSSSNRPVRRGRGGWRAKFRNMRQNRPKRFQSPDGFRWVHADQYEDLFHVVEDAYDDEDLDEQIDNPVEEEVVYDDADGQTEGLSIINENYVDLTDSFRIITTEDLNKFTEDDFLNFDDLFEQDLINYSILRSGININCKFGNEQVKCRTILDSGATRSLVHEDFLKLFNPKRILKTPSKARVARAAGGKVVELAPYRASFTLPFKNFKLKFVNAVVTKEGPKDLMLLGLSDLVRNDFDFKCSNNRIEHCRLHNLDILKNEKIELDAESDIFGLRMETPPTEELVKLNINQDTLTKKLKKVDSSDSLCNYHDTPINSREAAKKNPDGEKAFWSEIEKIRNDLLDSNSMGEVKIDPENEFSDPQYDNLKSSINKILDENKILFRGDCGHVKDERYIVRGEIKGTLVGKSTPNYYSKMSDQVKNDLVTKLNTEIANGILQRLPKGQTPKHVLPIFPVGKRGDDGNIVLNTNSIRLVADCSRSINVATHFSATQSDNLKSIIQKIAKYTKKGLVCSLDISQMFFSFEIERKLQPYFCVEHPTCGIFAYTRLPMGWVCSVANSREFLMRMLYAHKDYTTRYLDDLCVFGEDEAEFLENLAAVLRTLKYFGFRLKGKKMRILGKEIDLLGKRIKNGKIFPSKHCITNIDNIIQSNIVTKRQLKSFIGLVSYISDHIPFQADLLNDLRNAAKGVLADKVEWSESLIQNFEHVRSITNKLLTIHPVLEDRPIHCVVDSSIFATGAFFYQTSAEDPKVKRFIKIFSRRRSDFDNKHAISSCQCELNGILAAMTAASTEIELCKEKVFIHTDSKSVADIYKKLRNMEIPSADRRINSAFAKLMVFNYEINYVSNKELPIIAADYISRTEEASVDCSGCTVCKAVSLPQEVFANNIEIFCRDICSTKFKTQLTPTVSLEEFMSLQVPLGMDVPFDTSPYGRGSNAFFDSLSPKTDELEELFTFNTDVAYVLRHKRPKFDANLTLNDILENRERLIEWQNESKDFRKAKELLISGMAATKKLNTVQTLLEKRQCFLTDGVLCVKKFDSVRELTCILLPESKTAQVCEATHNTLGHSAMFRIIKEVKRRFHVPNVIPYVRTMTSNCQDCTFLRHNPKIFRPMKDFEDEIPDTIGTHILVDEITRTKRIHIPKGAITRNNKVEHGVVWRFVFATDIVSRFSLLTPINGNAALNSKQLRDILIDFKFRLSANQNLKMSMMMDGCSIHAALVDDDTLNGHNISINIKPRTSGSKNYLAMLDSRVAKVSILLNQEMQSDSIPKYAAARNAIARFNSTSTGEGWSPWENYHSRDAVTGKQINIDLKKILATSRHLRESSRASKEKLIKKSRFREPISFIPFEKGMTYDNPNCMPIKLGDRVLIDKGGFDKNETAPWYVVCKHVDFPQGIDFEKKLVATKKVGLKNESRVYVWQLPWIKQICNGNGNISVNHLGHMFCVTNGVPEPIGDSIMSIDYYDSFRNMDKFRMVANPAPERNSEESESCEVMEYEPVSYCSD